MNLINTEFAKRRNLLLEKMEPNSVAIIRTAPEIYRNGDSYYPYRPNSNFYYLTGFVEPEAIAVLIKNGEERKYILFNRPRDSLQEQWTGVFSGQEGAVERYGADQAFPIQEFDKTILELLQEKETIYYLIGMDYTLDQKIPEWFRVSQKSIRGGSKLNQLLNLNSLLSEMRLYKSEFELNKMRQAAKISAQAHCYAIAKTRPGMYEYELEAAIMREFLVKGVRAPAYSSIVGSGRNSCVLHYCDNNQRIQSGDLILIDAGAEYHYYASDITRTFPANGKFTNEQRCIYQVVLDAQLAVIETIKPGVRFEQLEQIARQLITQGLLKHGLLKGRYEELLSTRAYRHFYMHSVSHWLGLDVHDVGSYREADGQSRLLRAGMVLTVEPGIYIQTGMEQVDPKWWNIGIRIEDDVLITESGCEILSKDVPKNISEIEALVGSGY